MKMSAENVLKYLHEHPDFLNQFGSQLGVRPDEKKIISFNQASLNALEKDNQRMRAALNEVFDDVQFNHDLLKNLLVMDHALLGVKTSLQFIYAVSDVLTHSFHLPHHALCFVVDAPSTARVPKKWDKRSEKDICLAVSKIKQPKCGTNISAVLRSLLPESLPLGSFLQLPIHWEGQDIAMLLIAHEDANYFHPKLALDFVSLMSQSMAITLARLLKLS